MRQDRRPLPVQLREEILSIIEAGMKPGDRLPTEAELAARFRVGRTTAREALKLLERDGLIDVRHGSGRFVSRAATLERPITRLESVTEMMSALGYSLTNRIVSVTLRGASEEEAAALGLAGGETVVDLERVRLHDGEPLIYSVDVIPHSLVHQPVDTIDWSGSLLALLEANGARVTSAMAQLRVERLPEPAQRAIGKPSDDPWILLVQRNIDEQGNVVILSHDYHRFDSFTFNVFRQRA